MLRNPRMPRIPRKKSAVIVFLLCLPAVGIGPQARPAAAQSNPVPISSDIPQDIPGGAPGASLTAAAAFAWQEFVALNWPNLGGRRAAADPTALFGTFTKPLVWETMRGKVELYPGTGIPHGYTSNPLTNMGWDDPPRYVYSQKGLRADELGVGGPYAGLAPGEVPACTGQAPVATPALINLDESSQIGFDTMSAGAAPPDTDTGQQILFMAKVSFWEYFYVTAYGWYDNATVAPIRARTATYVKNNGSSPPPYSSQYVSLPPGTVEVKAAWRKLTSRESASGRFVTAPARYYQRQNPGQTYGGQPGNSQYPCWREDTFGLLSLHLIQKTPSAPYFIFATFSQADNLLDAEGNPVEDDNGNPTGKGLPLPYTPLITSQNATASSNQVLSPPSANCTPNSQLYYRNAPGPSTQGTVCVNRRVNPIPNEVIALNQTAHQSILCYLFTHNLGTDNPFLHYKLVNVQAHPIDKPTPGTDYTGSDAATYYQANEVVETDYNLQKFSGHVLFTPGVNNLITDFEPGVPRFHNTFASGQGYNMGGCMGCHGNAQSLLGSDFSFVLAFGRVSQPDIPGGAAGQNNSLARYLRLVKSH